MSEKYNPPKYQEDAYNCPHCGAYSHQFWHNIKIFDPFQNHHAQKYDTPAFVCICQKCENFQIWVDKAIYYPKSSCAPLPSEDMPDEVKIDFYEARDIVDSSPRAAAALLRLALQKLMIFFGEEGKDLNTDIGNLIKNKGLPVRIQQALDNIRVIGNESVHPGQIDLRDDPPTAIALFEMLNIIVDNMITQPKMIEKTFKTLPETKQAQIEKRDSK